MRPSLRPLLLAASSLLLVASLSAPPAQAGCPPTGCVTFPVEPPCLPGQATVMCVVQAACGLKPLDLLPFHPCEDPGHLPACPPSTFGAVVGPVEACVGQGACPPGYVGRRVWLSAVSTSLGPACVAASPCSLPDVGARVGVLGGPVVGGCLARQPLPVGIDRDGDGVQDDADDCPAVSNPSQADRDRDGLGDACDPDLDGDGVPNGRDPDSDGDGWDNRFDTDDDGDGDPDASDPTPTGPATPLG